MTLIFNSLAQISSILFLSTTQMLILGRIRVGDKEREEGAKMGL